MRATNKNPESMAARVTKLRAMGLEVGNVDYNAGMWIDGQWCYFDFSATAFDLFGVELAKQVFEMGYKKGQVNLKKQMRNLLDIPDPQE